jgi:mono/diheme cytochrome c family protein
MKRIVMTGVVALALLAGTAAAQDAKVQKGMKLYATEKCSQCHSIAGKGNPKGNLDKVGSQLTTAEIHDWLVDPAGMTAKTKKDRKPPMKKKAMAADDVDALVAYLSTLK